MQQLIRGISINCRLVGLKRVRKARVSKIFISCFWTTSLHVPQKCWKSSKILSGNQAKARLQAGKFVFHLLTSWWTFLFCKQLSLGLAVGTEGRDDSVPALFISSFNQTARYYFYTNFEAGIPKPEVYDIPPTCSTPAGINFDDVSPYYLVKTVIDLVFRWRLLCFWVTMCE